MTEEDRVLMCKTADPEVARELEIVKSSPEAENDNYKVEHGLLYRKHGNRLLFVMSKAMRKSLLVTAHDLSGHPAIDRTMSNLLQDFWFPKMRRYVRQHIHMCFECLLSKNPKGKKTRAVTPNTGGTTAIPDCTHRPCRAVCDDHYRE